ncbi:helix-turn-helix transcriptional regulator [Oceanobacillus caeni]|uniref:helix-turn-helix domain-containing protein n=1 Tax=Oceanobacillus caeni TaxID=405946 RepID=UPI00214A4117|nr:helix-turn-helix transcriptional regulator [Oceanobacillus caeni]MCR1833096.1 helix-turn-helix transcriptional regulator [Oceanobacillus caeni]
MRKLKVNLFPLMANKDIRTVKELAYKTGLSSKALYSIINGKTKRIDFNTIISLCEVLDCEIDQLLVLVGEKKAG